MISKKEEPADVSRGLLNQQSDSLSPNNIEQKRRVINKHSELPILRGFGVRNQVVVHCPRCDRFHKHGWDRQDNARVITSRGAHGDHQPPAPHQYRISVFRQADLKRIVAAAAPKKTEGGGAMITDESIKKLPEQIREQIEACPVKGQGVNPWLFKTALRLHQHFSEDEIERILLAYVSCDGRELEIRRAVMNSGRIVRGETPSSGPPKAWPAVDYIMIHKIVVNSPVRLKDLRAISPVGVGSEELKTEEILDTLFPGNPLLCFGRSQNSFWTKPRELWRGRESGMQFIVPNAMASLHGKTKEGKDSARCLDNTGERQFLVIEFDIAEAGDWEPYVKEWQTRGISIFDAQAALLVHLATKDVPRFRLTMAVHSGKKSLHGWFRCREIPEEQTRAFMARATRIGADPATWTKCQLVRMPGGTRDDGSRQRVEYFNPGKQEWRK